MSSPNEHTRLIVQPRTRRFDDFIDDDDNSHLPIHTAINVGATESTVYDADLTNNNNNNNNDDNNNNNNNSGNNSLRHDSDESIALRRRMSSWWLVNNDKPNNNNNNNNNNGNNNDDDDNNLNNLYDRPRGKVLFDGFFLSRELSLNSVFCKKDDDKWSGVRDAWRKLPYYIPVTMWLPAYKWRTMLLRDLIAGFAVASLLIPQSLAYALLAGMPPIYGLYTAFFPTFIYAMMGQSRHLSMGPDALVSILFGLAVPLAPDNPIALAQIVTLFVGIFLFVLGLLRLGFLDVILSRPLLAGFINAVVVEIIMEQLTSLFGIPTPTDLHGWHKMFFAFSHMDLASSLTAVVGFTNIAILLSSRVIKTFAKKRWPNVVLFPDLLIVVALNIGFSYGFDLQAHGLKTLGNVGTGFAVPSLPPIAALDVDVAELVRTILVIAMIGFVESIVAAKVSANKNGYSVSANRELVAYGLSNVFSSFFGVWPTFGSLTRTSIAELAGAASLVYSIVAAFVVLGTIFFLGPVFSYMPRVCGSAIIVVAALNLVEVHDVVFLWRLRSWTSLSLFLFTFIVTVLEGVELGVTSSFVISLFLVLKRVSSPHADELGRLKAPDGTMHFKCLSDYPAARPVPGVAIVRLGDPLFFGNSSALKTLLNRIERYGALHAHPSTRSGERILRGIVLHCAHVPSIDPTALFTLREIADDCRARGVKFVFVKLRDELKRRFLLAGIITPVAGELSIFPDTSSAVDAVLGNAGDLYSNHQRRFLENEPRAQSAPAVRLESEKQDDESTTSHAISYQTRLPEA
jgi:high affinity sulfate transporter 1